MPLKYTLKRILSDEHVETATSVAFSPDGLILATGSSSGRVAIWSVEEGQVMDAFVGRSAVTALKWVQGPTKSKASQGIIFVGWQFGDMAIIPFKSTRAMKLATGGGDGIKTWSLSDESKLKALRTMSMPESTAANAGKPCRVASIHWMDNSERLVATFIDHGIIVYDASTSQIIQVVHVPTMIGSGSLSPDNQSVVVHNLANGFDSYELQTGKLLKEYRHQSCEYGLERLPCPSLHVHQGSTILGGTPSGLSCLWDAGDGSLITTLEHSSGTVQAMAVRSLL
ncbi:WD40 repeat-like protein [Rickenella mellea]|uniref:WD40 repeat-like protein n=1 Tax=Rickenella mellea TaxID=50990 RepID=A0A4Y7PMN9_9AGAM|nr:WD40 repeat-like protein [Rickenella mellea]